MGKIITCTTKVVFLRELYNKLPIVIQKLDIISEFKVSLRGHSLWYSYLTKIKVQTTFTENHVSMDLKII